MRRRRRIARNFIGVMILFILGLTSPAESAFAKKEPKSYPEEGKIVATGLNQYATVNNQKKFTHIYTVETSTKAYVLDCDRRPVFASTGDECGGDKKLQIGDVIHFRLEKGWAYIPIAQTLSPVEPAKQGEQKLRVLSEELKPGN